MILYALQDGGYVDYEEIACQNPVQERKVYVNLTNRCNCACTFCLRTTKAQRAENSLWLSKEPEAADIIAAFEKYDLANMDEIVFCGFGEPTLRLETLLEVARYLKGRSAAVRLRLNTNGLSDLEYERDTAPLLQGLIDRVSISLNASTEEAYCRVTRNRFGPASYAAMLSFAQQCKACVPEVMLTVVDCIGKAEIAACRAVCERVGVRLRVRPFE